MFAHKYLTWWEHAQLIFWSKLFVAGCKLTVRVTPDTWTVVRPVLVWFDEQQWKQLRKIPK